MAFHDGLQDLLEPFLVILVEDHCLEDAVDKELYQQPVLFLILLLHRPDPAEDYHESVYLVPFEVVVVLYKVPLHGALED